MKTATIDTKMEDRKKWLARANKESVRQIHRKWGEGWKFLGEEIQRAIIAEHIIYIFQGVDEDTKINSARIEERHFSLLRYCGLME